MPTCEEVDDMLKVINALLVAGDQAEAYFKVLQAVTYMLDAEEAGHLKGATSTREFKLKTHKIKVTYDYIN